jgi:hypothetical protein
MENDPVLAAVNALKSLIEEHIKDETVQIASIKSAFPNGDTIAHREAHEAWIDEVKSRADFWKKMKFELAKWGLIGFLGWSAIQLWQAFLKGH